MKQFLTKTIKEAGKIILKDYLGNNTDKFTRKAERELVTKTDLKSEKYIISALRKKFPDYNIISEESGEMNNNSDYTWLIDPLDGTTNFTIRSPFFAINIALLYKNEIKLGIGYAPVLKELYYTEKGRGVYLNNHKIKVSEDKKVHNSVILYCTGGTKKDPSELKKITTAFEMKAQSLKQFGAAMLELAYVAAGRVESIMIMGAKTWDLAVGVLMVREAGGRVTDFDGKEWDLSSKNMLATNGKIHSEVIKIINNSE